MRSEVHGTQGDVGALKAFVEAGVVDVWIRLYEVVAQDIHAQGACKLSGCVTDFSYACDEERFPGTFSSREVVAMKGVPLRALEGEFAQ